MPRKKINKEEILDEKTKESVDALENDLSTYSALEALANSEGGTLLIKTLKEDLTGCINALKSTYKTCTHTELIALAAKIEARVDILRSITRAKKNYDLANDYLEEIIS